MFEEYLRELERAQTDGQTERQTNQMHKHFSTLLESVKKLLANFPMSFERSYGFQF